MSLFSALLGAAVTVETPIAGLTGVWIKAGGVASSSGMKMSGVTVTSGQSQYVYSRGGAEAETVSSGGVIYVSNGGIVSGVSARDSAAISAYTGATLYDVFLMNSARIG